jgi:hypothetical protein
MRNWFNTPPPCGSKGTGPKKLHSGATKALIDSGTTLGAQAHVGGGHHPYPRC